MSSSRLDSFKKDFKRIIVKADFKPSDRVLNAAFRGGMSYDSISSYLRGGRTGRFFDRLWRVLVMLLFGFAFLITIIAWPSVAKEANAWLGAAAVALALYSLWMVLVSQAWLRWMYRQRRAPRRKS